MLPWRQRDATTLARLGAAAFVAVCVTWLCWGGATGALREFADIPPGQPSWTLNVNAAAWPELAQLPGIGETLARRIVEHRETAGPFATVMDLEQVRGIGPAKLRAMLPYVRTDSEPEAAQSSR